MQITEPMTMLTDYLLTAGSLLFAIRLKGVQGQVGRKLWRWGFLLVAVAAATGGTYHGFVLYLGESLSLALWNVTVYSMGLASGLMIAGTLAASLDRGDESVRWFLSGVGVTLLALGVQQGDIGFHEHFNHNDLAHCILLLALYLFYRGARVLPDR